MLIHSLTISQLHGSYLVYISEVYVLAISQISKSCLVKVCLSLIFSLFPVPLVVETAEIESKDDDNNKLD